MKEYAVRTENLQKVYGTQHVLEQVAIHIERGAIYGLIGRNGAGKTTLMKLITGLAHATNGDVYLFGEEINDNVYNQIRIGNLIENPGLYENMNAFENLQLQAIAMGVYNKKKMEELLDFVGLGNAGKKKVKNFSMGMKQRLGIAMALVGSPDMLILDEPINGLDPQGIIEIRELVIKLNKERNMTILISSHILDELAKVATCFGIINQGQIIMEVSNEELSEKCAEKIEILTKETAKAGVILEKMGISDYTVVDQGTIHVFGCINRSTEITEQLVSAGVPVQSISIKSESLEEFFLKITADSNERGTCR